MISSSKSTYYSTDLVYRKGDLVVLMTDLSPRNIKNPTVCRVVDLERPPKTFGLHDQKLQLECIKTGLTTASNGSEVLKYDTFLIFAVMGMFDALGKCSFNSGVTVI